MPRIHYADKLRAETMLVAISRGDLSVVYEIDPPDEEDRLGESRLVIAEDIIVTETFVLEHKALTGPKDVPGYVVCRARETIGHTTDFEEAIFMAVYYQMRRDWKDYTAVTEGL